MLFVHDNPIRRRSGQERHPVGNLGPGRIVVECDIGQEITEHGDEQGQMAIGGLSEDHLEQGPALSCGPPLRVG